MGTNITTNHCNYSPVTNEEFLFTEELCCIRV